MKKCHACGHENDDQAVNCERCCVALKNNTKQDEQEEKHSRPSRRK